MSLYVLFGQVYTISKVYVRVMAYHILINSNVYNNTSIYFGLPVRPYLASLSKTLA